jgi:hypothetical protein
MHSRKIREYVEIDSHRSLDDVISELTRVRDSLPDAAEPEIRMRGDDIFGRHLCVTFLRSLTPQEAAVEARYLNAGLKELFAAA